MHLTPGDFVIGFGSFTSWAVAFALVIAVIWGAQRTITKAYRLDVSQLPQLASTLKKARWLRLFGLVFAVFLVLSPVKTWTPKSLEVLAPTIAGLAIVAVSLWADRIVYRTPDLQPQGEWQSNDYMPWTMLVWGVVGFISLLVTAGFGAFVWERDAAGQIVPRENAPCNALDVTASDRVSDLEGIATVVAPISSNTVPQIAGFAVLMTVATWAIRHVAKRPLLGTTNTLIQLDDSIRRRNIEGIVSAVSLAIWVGVLTTWMGLIVTWGTTCGHITTYETFINVFGFLWWLLSLIAVLFYFAKLVISTIGQRKEALVAVRK